MLKKKFGKGLLMFLAFVIMLTMSVFAYGNLSYAKMKGRVGQVETQKNSEATNLGLYGGQSNDIAVDSTSSNVYITTMAPNGFFISDNEGASFHGLPGDVNFGIGKQVEIDSNNGDVYALIGDSIIKSTDHGVNFSDITANLGFNGALGEKMLYGHNRLLVSAMGGPGQGGNIVISSDNGASFSAKTIGTGTVYSLAASPTAGTFFAAVSGNESEKLYRSVDYGDNWSEVVILAGQRISVVAVDPADANHIVITNTRGTSSNSIETINGGTIWTAITDSFGQPIAANYVAFDGTRMYIGQHYKEGGVWHQFNNQTPNSSIYADVFAFDPNNVNILFTNSVYSLAKSINRGASWTDQVNGVTSVKTYDISQANKKSIVWIAANGGLGKTTNFTAASPTWEYPVSGTGDATAYAVWVNPDNTNIVLYGDRHTMMRSLDGGSTWTSVATFGPGGGNIRGIESVPDDNSILYAVLGNDDLAGVDSGYVYKSTDTGKTWTDLQIPDNAPAYSLTINKDGVVFVGASSNDIAAPKGIYRYKKGSWKKLTSSKVADKSVSSVLADPENADIIYATLTAFPQGGGFYKSEDSGDTWTKKDEGLKSVNHLGALTVQISTKPNTLYLAGQASNLNGAIYKSSDGGESWGQYFEGLKQETFYALLFDGLTAGNDRGLYEMKSKASLTLKAGKKKVTKGTEVLMTLILKDKATKKKLKNKKVTIMKKLKKNKKFKKFKTVKTDEKGKVNFYVTVKAKKKLFLKAKWTPKKKAKQEYAVAKSKQVKIKIQK